MNVRWNTPRPCGWAGEGFVKIVQADETRQGFGGKFPEPGPAVEIETATGLRVWVRPDELEEVT